MTKYISKRPMLFSAILACAICMSGLISETALIIVGSLIILLTVFLIAAKGNYRIIVPLVMLFILTLSYLNCYSVIEKSENLSGKTVEGEFNVVKSPKVYEKYCSTVLEVNECSEIDMGQRIFVFFNYSDIDCGEKIKAEIKLESLKNSKYKLKNYSEGIFLMGNIKSSEILKGENDAITPAI